jgi:DNA-binding LacI/PurR family transcriptional regulator
MEAARERGVQVPTQGTLLGLDDRPLTRYLTPPLTRLRLPFDRVGAEATRLLLRRVAGEAVPSFVHLFEPELIVRGSTAPPGL